MVTVNGNRHLVGISGDQWYVLNVSTGETELCANYATARLLSNERNSFAGRVREANSLVKQVTRRYGVGE